MPKPADRLTSLAIACLLHVLCLWALISPFKTHETRTVAPATVAQKSAAPKPAASAPTETSRRDDERDAYVPNPPSLRVYGFEFDLRKIRERWRDLFPFVTASLSFRSIARVQEHDDGGLTFADPTIVPPCTTTTPTWPTNAASRPSRL